jgi:Flp pilus assembly protein TadG
MKNSGFRNPRAAQGQSLVELAIILPVLLMLALGVVDFARAIQFNNILVAMSREGANLSARTSEPPQDIITALVSTAEPLVMNTYGMVYITQIMGTNVNGTVEARVQAQTRAKTGRTSLTSDVWNSCSSWNAGTGSCNTIPAGAKATLSMSLIDGEVVYAVEMLYDYDVIVSYVMKTGPKLYSLTVL